MEQPLEQFKTIKDRPTAHFLLIKLQERNGEQEYTIPHLIVTTQQDTAAIAEEIAATWYDGINYPDYEFMGAATYFFMNGTISVRVKSVTELSKQDFEILSKYL